MYAELSPENCFPVRLTSVSDFSFKAQNYFRRESQNLISNSAAERAVYTFQQEAYNILAAITMDKII